MAIRKREIINSIDLHFNFNNNNNNNNINNNNNNQNSGINSNNDDSEEDGKLSILFKRRNKDDDKKNFSITILCCKNELLDAVVKRYCHKTQEDPKKLLFLFNSKQLDIRQTVEMAGFQKGSIVLVIDVGPMKGGF
jgi:hypothetical protein